MMQHVADGDYNGADCDGGDAKHETCLKGHFVTANPH